MLIAQEQTEVTVLQRSKNWQAEVLRGREQIIQIESIQFALQLSAIYEGVKV